jgi:hypothetical protein
MVSLKMKLPWQRYDRYPSAGPYFFSIVAALFSDLYHSRHGKFLRKVAHALDRTIDFFVPRFVTDLRPRAKQLQLWPIFWLSALIGTFWSLIGNGLFAMLNGTFCGTSSAVSKTINEISRNFCAADPTIYYYTDDIPNLLIYFPLTPLYIGLSVCIIVVWASGYKKLQSIVDISPEQPPSAPTFRTALLSSLPFFALLFIPLLFTLNYALEYAHVKPNTKMFWYLHKVYQTTTGGNVPLYYYDISGIYYLVSNNVKLLIVVSAIICFLTMSLLVIHFGSNIGAYDFVKKGNASAVSDMLLDYNLNVTLIKWLVFVLSIHFLCWSESRTDHGINIKVSAALLICIGVFFLNTPRYYAEERFLRYIENNTPSENAALPKYQDFRTDRYKFMQSLTDTLTIISALSIAVTILFGFDFSISKPFRVDLTIK